MIKLNLEELPNIWARLQATASDRKHLHEIRLSQKKSVMYLRLLANRVPPKPRFSFRGHTASTVTYVHTHTHTCVRRSSLKQQACFR